MVWLLIIYVDYWITGINDNDDGTKPREEIVKDTFRIEYHKTHFEELHKAIVLVLDLFLV